MVSVGVARTTSAQFIVHMHVASVHVFTVPIDIQHRGGEKPVSYHSKIDADIDSLTSMLADLDSHTQDSGAQVMKDLFNFSITYFHIDHPGSGVF